MEYDILIGASSFDLCAKVRLKMEQGWQPLGGVAIRDDLFAQAITRTKLQWTVTTQPPQDQYGTVTFRPLTETVKADFR